MGDLILASGLEVQVTTWDFFLFLATMQKFWGQILNLCHSTDNARSLTHQPTREFHGAFDWKLKLGGLVVSDANSK